MAHPDEFVEELDRYRNSGVPGFGGSGSGASAGGPGGPGGTGGAPHTPQRPDDADGLLTPVPLDTQAPHPSARFSSQQQLRVSRGNDASTAFGSTPAACHSHHPDAYYPTMSINDTHHPINVISEDRERATGLSDLEANSSTSTTFAAGLPAGSEQNPWLGGAASRLMFSTGKSRGQGQQPSDDARLTTNGLHAAESQSAGAPPGSNFVGWSLKRFVQEPLSLRGAKLAQHGKDLLR